MDRDIQTVMPIDVLAVYSGKNGACCCGCSGKHTYNPNWINLGGEIRGYELDKEDCSLRTVKLILNKFKKAKNVVYEDNQFYFTTEGTKSYEQDYVHYARRVPGRLYILRLVPPIEERERMRRDRMKRKEEAALKLAQEKADKLEALKGEGI